MAKVLDYSHGFSPIGPKHPAAQPNLADHCRPTSQTQVVQLHLKVVTHLGIDNLERVLGDRPHF